MTKAQHHERGGWQVGQSIALELDVALYAAGEYFIGANLSDEVMAFFQSIGSDWQEEYRALVGESRNFLAVLEPAAQLAGLLFESDYSRVTLAIREMSIETALDQVKRASAQMGLAADASLPLFEQFIDLELRVRIAIFQNLGFDVSQNTPQISVMRRSYERVARILRGGDLHARYWHLLDRFYYEYYLPWRTAHAGVLKEMEQYALTVLGSPERASEPPNIDWLPAQNPIRIYPELSQAVQEGRLHVFFWVEPFGLADTWTLLSDTLIISFAQPGLIYQNFLAFVGDVAERAKALADPTRLTILRLIRHFGLVNTEIADYLGIARPTVSIHAKILRQAGLIRSHQEGRVMRHEILPEEIRRLFRDLEQVLDLPEQ